MNVKINQKTYKVPELTFRHFTIMEEQGFSVVDAFQKRQMMLLAMGFTCAVVGCEREEAERLLEQHVLGGGNLVDIVSVFGKAIQESDFFSRMLGQNKIQEVPEETEEATKEEKNEK